MNFEVPKGQLLTINEPILFVFAGLPCTGKTTLAKILVQETGASYLRVDTIEQGLRDLCDINVTGEGYRLSYRIATDNLSLGQSVIADSCNPIIMTRKEWTYVSNTTRSKIINIEIVCSDEEEHKRRVFNRKTDIPNLDLPDWDAITERHYDHWQTSRIIIDTANRSKEESFAKLIQNIKMSIDF